MSPVRGLAERLGGPTAVPFRLTVLAFLWHNLQAPDLHGETSSATVSLHQRLDWQFPKEDPDNVSKPVCRPQSFLYAMLNLSNFWEAGKVCGHGPPKWILNYATPPPAALQGAATPLLRLFPRLSVSQGSQLHPPPPPPKRPCCTPSRTTVWNLSWLLGRRGVALPPARGVPGSLDVRSPVALQGVEQLHLRVSRYTLTQRSWKTHCTQIGLSHARKNANTAETLFFADWNLSNTELESGNALGAFLQTSAPVLDKNSGPMGAQFLSSTGLGFVNLIERAQIFPVPALDKNQSPILPGVWGLYGVLTPFSPYYFQVWRPIALHTLLTQSLRFGVFWLSSKGVSLSR